MDNRNSTIDCFRALAVILVTFYHVYRHIRPEYNLFGINLFNPLLNGWMGVGFFFVISGYCMGMATSAMQKTGVTFSSFSKYIKKRFLRICIPYYMAIIFWVVAINFFHIASKSTSVYDILTHVLFVHNLDMNTMYSISGVFWSLAVEMQFYLLMPVLLIFYKTEKSRLLLLACLFMVSLTIHVFAGENRYLTWGLPSYLFVFVFGWLLFLNRSAIGEIVGSAKFISLFSLIFLVMLSIDYEYINANKFYEILVSIVFGFLMMSFIGWSNNKNSESGILVWILSKIGLMSYSIYLYNYSYFIFGAPDKNSNGILLVIFVLIFGSAMYAIIEKPFEKFRKKRMGSITRFGNSTN